MADTNYLASKSYTKEALVKEPARNRKVFACKVCGVEFENSTELRVHSLAHKDDDTITCGSCERNFANQRLLTRHVKRVHEKSGCKCASCGLSFMNEASLLRHERRLHLTPSQCEECGKSFTSKTKLKMHMRIHSGATQYNCSVCSRMFMYKSSLEEHEKHHSGQKTVKCEQCEKYFFSELRLSIHVRRAHNTVRPYPCNICGRAFPEAWKLRKHLETHARKQEGLRPVHEIRPIPIAGENGARGIDNNAHTVEFDCPSSPKRRKSSRIKSLEDFKEISNKADVQKLRSLYVCANCPEEFQMKEDLKNHASSCSKAAPAHSTNSSKQCRKCDKSFSDARSLRKHWFGIHGDTNVSFCLSCWFAFPKDEALDEHLGPKRQCPSSKPALMAGTKPDDTPLRPFRKKTKKCQTFNPQGTEQYTCSICLERFDDICVLSRHMAKHKEGLLAQLKTNPASNISVPDRLLAQQQWKKTFNTPQSSKVMIPSGAKCVTGSGSLVGQPRAAINSVVHVQGGPVLVPLSSQSIRWMQVPKSCPMTGGKSVQLLEPLRPCVPGTGTPVLLMPVSKPNVVQPGPGKSCDKQSVVTSSATPAGGVRLVQVPKPSIAAPRQAGQLVFVQGVPPETAATGQPIQLVPVGGSGGRRGASAGPTVQLVPVQKATVLPSKPAQKAQGSMNCSKESQDMHHCIAKGHRSDSAYGCEMCDSGFNSEGKLKDHMVSHYEDMSRICSECGQVFSFVEDLHQHKKTCSRPNERFQPLVNASTTASTAATHGQQ